MPIFCKKLNTGSHSFRLKNGKRVSVVSGGYVECELSDLGNQVHNYVELTREIAKQYNSQTPLKREIARFESLLRPDSWILYPDWTPPFGSFVFTPKDKDGLEQVLANLIETEGICKNNLHEAWNHWKGCVARDPLQEMVLKSPDDRHLEPIARAQAALNICQAEAQEIRARISAIVEVEIDNTALIRKKLFMAGRMRSGPDGKFREVDGIPVTYVSKTPMVPELNISLREYLDKVKAYKNEKAFSKSKKAIAARKAFLDNRKEERLLAQQSEARHE